MSFPREMQHFADCVLNDQQPLGTGEDGKAVLEIIFAAYESARTGCKVPLPFTPPSWVHSPIHCWKPWPSPDCPDDLQGDARERKWWWRASHVPQQVIVASHP